MLITGAGRHVFPSTETSQNGRQFTVRDPETWTKPFTGQVPMRKSNKLPYEYACHEGNYGMFGILSAARAVENAAAEVAKKGSR